MVTFEDVARLALALPGTEETTSYGNTSWAVTSGGKAKGKGFVWERPLSKKDRKLLTEAGEIEVPPDEVILAARVEDLAEKEAVLAEHAGAVFTTPHFNGYPAVLVRLDRVDEQLLREIVTSAWLAVAPTRLAEELTNQDDAG
ncbi:MAG TPA: MmcQ/YjbR family DNA-binding protein [Microlunatus sp.]|nr:MmcQ/YjbR family DNA-binding protein [Microlunatus sp.]